jgi:outer membrane protein assembly factor BamB
VAVVTDPRTVALLDLSTGTFTWTYREPSSLPRSGPPRLLGDAGCLLVLRDGSEVVRLDPATGNKLWSRVVGVEDLSEWPEALAYDGERLYCATGRTLSAYSLADGAPAWRRHLSGPTGGWTVALARRCIAAFPSPGRSFGPEPADGLPLVLCRRDTGALVQRLFFSTRPTDLTVRFSPGAALVATQEGGWALTPRRLVDDPEDRR